MRRVYNVHYIYAAITCRSGRLSCSPYVCKLKLQPVVSEGSRALSSAKGRPDLVSPRPYLYGRVTLLSPRCLHWIKFVRKAAPVPSMDDDPPCLTPPFLLPGMMHMPILFSLPVPVVPEMTRQLDPSLLGQPAKLRKPFSVRREQFLDMTMGHELQRFSG